MLEDKWAGEDQSDGEIKDNWDDPDPVEEEKPAEPVPKKLTTKEKIAQREEKERLKKEQRMKEKASLKALTPEEQLARKLEEQKLQREGDLSLAMDAFGVSSSKSTNINLDEYTLSGKDDFDKFRANLVSKLAVVSSEPFYATFLEELFRELCVPVDTDDLKKISSSLTALYNEKLKAQRSTNNAKKKKGQTIKASVKYEKSNIAQNYQDDLDYDDELDFM